MRLGMYLVKAGTRLTFFILLNFNNPKEGLWDGLMKRVCEMERKRWADN